jgi:hypothetical protein
MDFKAELINLLKPLLKQVLTNIVFPELELVVKNSPNAVDDAVLAAMEPMLKEALNNAIDKI